MNFSENLKLLRKEFGYSAKTLSTMISFSTNIIYDWEKGRAQPNFDTLIKLANVFNVSVDYLLGIEDDFGNVSVNNNAGLTENEKRLLKAFNTLDDIEQEKLIEDAEFYANRSSISSKSIKNV